MAAVGGSAQRYLPLVREKAAGQGANHRVGAVVLLRPGQSRAVAAPQAEESTTPGFHHSVWHSLGALGGGARRHHRPPEGQAAGLQLPATLASRAQAPKEPKASSRRCGAAGPPPQSAPRWADYSSRQPAPGPPFPGAAPRPRAPEAAASPERAWLGGGGCPERG